MSRSFVVGCIAAGFAAGCAEQHGPTPPGPDDLFLMCDHTAAATLVLEEDATSCVEAVIGPGPTADCPEPPPCEEDICIDIGPWEPVAGVPVLLYVMQDHARVELTEDDGSIEVGVAYPSRQTCGSCLEHASTGVYPASPGATTGLGIGAGLARVYVATPSPATRVALCPYPESDWGF